MCDECVCELVVCREKGREMGVGRKESGVRWINDGKGLIGRFQVWPKNDRAKGAT